MAAGSGVTVAQTPQPGWWDFYGYGGGQYFGYFLFKVLCLGKREIRPSAHLGSSLGQHEVTSCDQAKDIDFNRLFPLHPLLSY